MAYATETDVREILRDPDSKCFTTSEITASLEVAEAWVDKESNSTFEAVGNQTDLFDNVRGESNSALPDTSNIRTTVFLSKYPVQSITSIKINGGDALAATGYESFLKEGRIEILQSLLPTDRVEVIYTYGEASVPALVKHLTALKAAYDVWSNSSAMKGSTTIEGTSVNIQGINDEVKQRLAELKRSYKAANIKVV